jgi:hypothetical protein
VLFASLIRWSMLLVVIGAVLWGLVQVYDRFLRSGGRDELSQTPDTG